MKKVLCMILCLLFSYSVVSMAETEKSDNLVFAIMDADSPPLWIKRNNEIEGVFVDGTKELIKRLGLNVTIINLPWKRLVALMARGEIDASMHGYKNSEREKFGIFIDTPMSYVSVGLYVLENNQYPFNSVKDLYGKVVGITRGYKTNSKLDAAVIEGKIKLEEVNIFQQSLKMLLFGRVKTMIGIVSSTDYEISQKGYTEIVRLPKLLTPAQGTMVWISKAANVSPYITDRISEIMSNMAEDGTLQRIHAKYGIDYLP